MTTKVWRCLQTRIGSEENQPEAQKIFSIYLHLSPRHCGGPPHPLDQIEVSPAGHINPWYVSTRRSHSEAYGNLSDSLETSRPLHPGRFNTHSWPRPSQTPAAPFKHPYLLRPGAQRSTAKTLSAPGRSRWSPGVSRDLSWNDIAV